MPQSDDFLSQLTPEQLEQLMRLGTADDESKALDEQMAQAQAMRSNNAQGHSTAIGAGLGGIGDIINAVGSGMQQNHVGTERKRVRDEQLKARKIFTDLMGRKPQTPDSTQPLSAQAQQIGPVKPFAYGEESQPENQYDYVPSAYGPRRGSY